MQTNNQTSAAGDNGRQLDCWVERRSIEEEQGTGDVRLIVGLNSSNCWYRSTMDASVNDGPQMLLVVGACATQQSR